MKRKKESPKLPGTSVYLIYLLIELFAALYIQKRIVLDPMWYAWNMVYATATYIMFRVFLLLIRRARLAGSSLRKIDKMTGEEFEAYLGLLYDRKGYDLIEEGTSGGGAVEVYRTVEDAESRNDYLGALDGGIFASGSHVVLGTMVLRTSDELKASQQETLTNAMIAAMIELD